MSNIIRVEHSKNYTVISNDAIRDKRLGLKARGLHHLLLSYPDNWKISIEHLAKEASDTDGRTAIQNALKELEAFGYLTREQVRDGKGRITGWENIVRELPQAGFPIVDKSTSGKSHNRKNRKRENPNVGNPCMGNPATENQYLINTDPYEVSKKEIPIPPNPPSGGTEESECEEKSASLEEEPEIPSQSILPSQPYQQSDSTNDNANHGDKDSAGGCDNSAFVGHGNVAPDGKTRPFNQLTGKWSSIPSDPWMEGINPAKEFKQWVCKQAIAEGKNYSLSNAAGEIRNNFQRAGDLWDEYLDAQEKARQTEIIKEQVQQETKPRAVEVTASQSQPTPFAFYRNAIKNRLPMLQQFRQRGIEWAEQQPDVVIIRDENGEIIDIEEF